MLVATTGIAVPVLSTTGASCGVEPPPGLPPELQPTEVNVHETLDRRYGEPQVAVNPQNPENIVVVSTDLGYVLGCQEPVR